MSQNQKTKNRRSLSKDRAVSSRKKTATLYTLELLESRVLLSADLAGAVQAAPIKADAPQQAVVLHVQAPATAGQQTFSVAEMLAKPASSFPQGVNEAGQATSHGNEPSAGLVATSSQPSSRDTRAVPDIQAQQQQTQTPLSSQSKAGPQPQVAPLTSSPTPTLTQSIATPVMTTLQNEQALPPTVQQSQQTPTDAQILALQTQQPVAQSATQQTVVSPGVTLPSEKNNGTSVSSTVQTPLVQQSQQTLTNAEIFALPTQQPTTQLTSQQSAAGLSQILPQQPSSVTQSQWTTILQKWEANMVKYGKEHGELMQSYDAMTGADAQTNSGMILGSTYYDAEQVYYKIAQYTGDQSWLQYAQLAEKFYRDQFVTPNNGQVPGYWNFTSGLLSDYLATGDPQSRTAILSIAQNAGYAQDSAPLEWTASAVYARDVSYAVISYTNAEIVGAPVRERKGELVNQLLDYVNQWFVQYNVPPGGEPHPADYLKPSFVGMAMNALIYSYDHSPDPRIPAAISVALDGLWNRGWMPEHQAFYYANTEESGTPPFTPAPDLNLLIAPAYAWMYKHTGDVTYRDRGDQVFAGGVEQAYLDGAKQFNQNYEWSFDYVTWRGN